MKVYVLYLPRAGARIVARCRDFDVDATQPILLVMASSRGPRQFADAIASWGERPLVVGKDDRLAGVVEAAAANITDFARQHPDTLIAREASGLPAPADANGERVVIWADLSSPTPVQVGDPRARAH